MPRFTFNMLLGCEPFFVSPAVGPRVDHEILPRYTPIFEQDFKEHVFSLFYETNTVEEQDPHKLALLFFVFAMGKLTDPGTRDLSTQEAMKYFHIGKAALSLNQSLETPSITLLQALLLMCHFMFLANIESSRWLTMGIIVKLSQSVCFVYLTRSNTKGSIIDRIA